MEERSMYLKQDRKGIQTRVGVLLSVFVHFRSSPTPLSKSVSSFLGDFAVAISTETVPLM